MSRIDITSSGTPLSDGMLQTANPLDATLQVVTDNVGNSSTVSLSTTETQINSVLRIRSNNSELLDIENTSGNRFNINRDVQKINLDFSSNPTGSTDIVGAIRTFIDGVNLSDVAQFQENGQVTLTERLKLESDSTVTTQTSAVIQSSTVNANLVIAPNGTGALVAAIPDGTSTGGNARGANAVDLQMIRVGGTSQSNVASGISSVISGGASNTASSNYSTVSGGQSNTASSGTHATVIGGASNTASGQHAIAGGFSNTASGPRSISIGGTASNIASGNRSVVIGGEGNTANNVNSSVINSMYSTASGSTSMVLNSGSGNTAGGDISMVINGGNTTGTRSIAFNNSVVTSTFGIAYNTNARVDLYNQFAVSNGANINGGSQGSQLVASKNDTLTTGATTVLSLDGTGVTNLIIPNILFSGATNRAWNVQVNWVAIVTTITGTATGISVGDVITSIDLLAFKRITGTSSASAHTSTATKLMVTTPAAYAACAIAFTAGASQEMALTFTGPTFVGGGSVTMRVVARIELTEVAF